MKTAYLKYKHSGIAIDLVMPLLYCGLTVVVAAILLINNHPAWIQQPHLCYGDCKLYRKIMQEGYFYKDGVRSTTNYFPLFPYVWRWSGLGEAGIAFINFLCFITGNFLLFRNFKASVMVKVVSLILGCIVFYMVPFTEGMFYLCSSVMLISVHKKKTTLTLVSLTAMCLLRSVSILFVPAWGAMFLFRYVQTNDIRKSLTYLGFACWGLMVILLLFCFFQYTIGDFWAFVKAERIWGTYLRTPQFYFGAWGDDRHMIFAQYAVMICLLSGLYLPRLCWQLWKRTPDIRLPDDATLFALLYMAANGLLPVLLRGGEFSALNRYILSTPFLYLFIRTAATVRFNRINVMILLFTEAVFLLVFWRMYLSPLRLMITGIFLGASVTVLWLLRSNRTAWVAVGLLIAAAIGIYLQAMQLVDFVHGAWVG